MSEADAEMQRLRRAGSDALLFNAPLSLARAESLVDELLDPHPATVVDIGCGRGALALLVSRRSPSTRVIGLDNDPQVVALAAQLAESTGVSDRLSFEVADGAEWKGEVDAAICVGASHVFGGTAEMMARLANLAPDGTALVGDGFWASDPDQWCVEVFGTLPNGLSDLADHATATGWMVEGAECSTLDEWDHFENSWAAGVRSLGSTEATEFAESRQAEYQRYRGVLGFGWLQLRR